MNNICRKGGHARRILIGMLLLWMGVPTGLLGQDAEPKNHTSEPSVFRVGGLRIWVFRSFMRDEGDDATVLGIELENYLRLGSYQIKNISYFEVDDFPRAVPGQPPGNSTPGVEPVTGVSDLLMGFWFSRLDAHHGNHHFAPGLAVQIPTASSSTLGSGKWSLGPSFDYEYENGRLFAGAIALQIWSFAGAGDRKAVSMLMIKPFVYFSLSGEWDLTYVPYGISVYWNKPSGEKMYLPLGGGVQRLFRVGSVDMNLGLQLFNYVIRPTNGTVWDLRFVADLAF